MVSNLSPLLYDYSLFLVLELILCKCSLSLLSSLSSNVPIFYYIHPSSYFPRLHLHFKNPHSPFWSVFNPPLLFTHLYNPFSSPHPPLSCHYPFFVVVYLYLFQMYLFISSACWDRRPCTELCKTNAIWTIWYLPFMLNVWLLNNCPKRVFSKQFKHLCMMKKQ